MSEVSLEQKLVTYQECGQRIQSVTIKIDILRTYISMIEFGNTDKIDEINEMLDVTSREVREYDEYIQNNFGTIDYGDYVMYREYTNKFKNGLDRAREISDNITQLFKRRQVSN